MYPSGSRADVHAQRDYSTAREILLYVRDDVWEVEAKMTDIQQAKRPVVAPSGNRSNPLTIVYQPIADLKLKPAKPAHPRLEADRSDRAQH